MELKYIDLNYKDSFQSYYDEYINDDTCNKQYYLNLYQLGIKDFESYILRLSKQSSGECLPEGWKPSHTMFLVDENEIVGGIRIRENLATEPIEKFIGHIGYDIRPSSRKKGFGKEILRLGLIKAKELELKSVLIICSEDNGISRKIIERNGGIYESNIITPDGDNLRRYWIDLTRRRR